MPKAIPKIIKLQDAVTEFVKDKGGEVVVVGAVGIMDRGPWHRNFYVVVECMGRRPDVNHKADPTEETKGGGDA